MSELIVALDGMAPDKALQVAGDLSNLQSNGLWGFKIGHSLTFAGVEWIKDCLLYTSPSPRDATLSRMPSSA